MINIGNAIWFGILGFLIGIFAGIFFTLQSSTLIERRKRERESAELIRSATRELEQVLKSKRNPPKE